ncbi:MAG: hypothetical protein M9955_19705 [Rhizobiaceae bacterium]|nr:hypothetical protein [Rhizobiaceae bacterium]
MIAALALLAAWPATIVLHRGLRAGRFATRGVVVRRAEKPIQFAAIAGLYLFALALLIVAAVIATIPMLR